MTMTTIAEPDDSTGDARTRESGDPTHATSSRRPWARPRFESGEAFERVQLASGCNEGVFDGCDVPC
jgi:hypothetical protein